MKKTLITLLLAIVILPLSAENAWKVEMVPNTRLQSDYIHVSDPDNYLKAETEMKINTALSSIRDSVDVFLVCLSTIGYEEPADFRSKLFNHWGIGDKSKDNGLLLLFVEDQHAFEFETGYGIEPILTDVKCFEIFNHTIKPYFIDGDYDGGMYAGILDIVKVFGGSEPTELITVLPDEKVYEEIKTEKDKEIMSAFYLWFIAFLVCGVPFISFLYYISTRKDDKKYNKEGGIFKDKYTITEKNGLRYINEPATSWSGSAWQGAGCSRSLNFGLSAIVWFFVVSIVLFAVMEGEEEIVIRNWIAGITIISYFSWICIKHNRRALKMADKVASNSIYPKQVYDKAKNYRRTKFVNFCAFWMGWYFKKKYDERKAKCPDFLCPECHEAMTVDATAQLPEIDMAEIVHEVMKYTSLHCNSGHSFIIKEKGKKYKSYTTCSHCGAHLNKFMNKTVITKANYNHGGVEENEYECEFCHEKMKNRVNIPKLVQAAAATGVYSSGHSSSSSHSSGGSFGGGRSGGGGYSGRW